MNRLNVKRNGKQVWAWLKIARLQFYPMPWLAYTLGAACAFSRHGLFEWAVYLNGYACIFLLELCAVLTNECVDYRTDLLNENAGPFTGGSRVVVHGELSFREVRFGIGTASFLLAVAAMLLVQQTHLLGAGEVLGILGLGYILAVGYSAPPLKFAYRGVGELVVAVTHSVYVLISGFLFQAGTRDVLLPWWLTVPIFFAVYAAITLSGLPDRRSDEAVEKRTLAVVFGPSVATGVAASSVVAAAASVVIMVGYQMVNSFGWIYVFLVVAHALFLLFGIGRMFKQRRFDCRIDGIMKTALTYILWFCLVPLTGVLWK